MSASHFADLIEEAQSWEDELPALGQVLIYRRDGRVHELQYWTREKAESAYADIVGVWRRSAALLSVEDESGTSIVIPLDECTGIELCADARAISAKNLHRIIWEAKIRRWGEAFDPRLGKVLAELFPPPPPPPAADELEVNWDAVTVEVQEPSQ